MFNNYREKYYEAQGKVEALQDKVKFLENQMTIQTGPFVDGWAPCEAWDAKVIKLKFEQIYDFLDVKLENQNEKLVKKFKSSK